MNCIQFYSSFPYLHSHPNHNNKQQFQTHKLLLPCNHQPIHRIAKFGKRIPCIRTRAAITTYPLILADTSTVKPGDVSVLLQTGGLLLFVYVIANFVVPAFISKHYGFDKETEGSVSKNDDEASTPKSKSEAKKRGFQGTGT